MASINIFLLINLKLWDCLLWYAENLFSISLTNNILRYIDCIWFKIQLLTYRVVNDTSWQQWQRWWTYFDIVYILFLHIQGRNAFVDNKTIKASHYWKSLPRTLMLCYCGGRESCFCSRIFWQQSAPLAIFLSSW